MKCRSPDKIIQNFRITLKFDNAVLWIEYVLSSSDCIYNVMALWFKIQIRKVDFIITQYYFHGAIYL